MDEAIRMYGPVMGWHYGKEWKEARLDLLHKSHARDHYDLAIQLVIATVDAEPAQFVQQIVSEHVLRLLGVLRVASAPAVLDRHNHEWLLRARRGVRHNV